MYAAALPPSSSPTSTSTCTVERKIRAVKSTVQPSIFPPRGRKGRRTNQLLYLERSVMPAIWAHPNATLFHYPVNALALNVPSYYAVIKYPMDLNTIRLRLKYAYYWSAEEAIRDFRRIFVNCYTFNSTDQIIRQMCHTVEEVFVRELRAMPEDELVDEAEAAAECQLEAMQLCATSISDQSAEEKVTQMAAPQPDAGADAGATKTQLSVCARILTELMLAAKQQQEHHNQYFLRTVDAAAALGLRDYTKIIKKPMDLKTVSRKLRTRAYASEFDFVADVRLMFRNCYAFNNAHAPITQSAQKLEDVFEQLVENLIVKPPFRSCSLKSSKRKQRLNSLLVQLKQSREQYRQLKHEVELKRLARRRRALAKGLDRMPKHGTVQRGNCLMGNFKHVNINKTEQAGQHVAVAAVAQSAACGSAAKAKKSSAALSFRHVKPSVCLT